MSEFEPKFENRKEVEIPKEEFERLKEKNRERLEREAENARTLEHAKQDSIEAIQARIERSAMSSRETMEHTNLETEAHESELRASTQLKGYALSQTIKRVQKQLPPSERVLSKVIHQPAVNAVSTAAESTVARPSGLMVGGLFSVISSFVVLYICRHYGYEYNFAIGLISFGGGFIIGLLLEGILKLFRRKPER